MLLLISDANILIDLEAGEILDSFFQLPYQFAMPDVLYEEEVAEGSPYLLNLGLKTLVVTVMSPTIALTAGGEAAARLEEVG